VTSEQLQAELVLGPSTLRDRLQELTETRDVSRHPMLLEELKRRLPNSIKCLSASSTHLRYNCVMYALGIHNSAEYVRMAMQCPEEVHASTSFLRFLIDKQETIITSTPSTGDMGVYLQGDAVKHVGRVLVGGRIQSKWGIGHLYDHSIEEAPASYGSAVRFYNPIDPATALEQFVRFAASHGVELR
jgi:hypothetical protein